MSTDIIYKDSVEIYRGSYRKEFGHKLVQHMRTGRSLASFAGSIGVSPTTLKRWEEEHPEFREAIEIAKSINMGKWEEIAIDQATGETKGNSATTTFMMKNLHPDEYKDKQVVENEGNVVFMIDTGVPDSVPQLEKNAPIEIEAVVIENEEDLL